MKLADLSFLKYFKNTVDKFYNSGNKGNWVKLAAYGRIVDDK
jgi:hypothetical protein